MKEKSKLKEQLQRLRDERNGIKRKEQVLPPEEEMDLPDEIDLPLLPPENE